MRHPWILLVAACSTEPFFEVSPEPACASSVLPYDDGPFAFLVAAGTDDGSFALDAPAPLVARVEGAFDLTDGTFAWTRTYDEAYWKVAEAVEGEGMVWPDGDIDLRFDATTTLDDGTKLLQEIRTTRLGCEVSTATKNRFGAVVSVEEGVVGADAYTYVRQRLEGELLVEVEGERTAAGASVEREAWRVDRVQVERERADDGQGVVVTTFEDVIDGVAYAGTVRQGVGGAERRKWTETGRGYAADFDVQLGFDGKGDGSVEYRPDNREPYTCEVKVRASCTVTCEGRGETECVVGGP